MSGESRAVCFSSPIASRPADVAYSEDDSSAAMNSNTCDVAGLGELLSRVDDNGSLQSKLWIII